LHRRSIRGTQKNRRIKRKSLLLIFTEEQGFFINLRGSRQRDYVPDFRTADRNFAPDILRYYKDVEILFIISFRSMMYSSISRFVFARSL